MKLTPLTVARSQLLTAIDLFFDDKDPISVQSLAGNARELLESLCRVEAIEPMADMLLADHPGRDKKWLYGAVNLYRNCFKHLGKTAAARDEDQKTLDQFNDGVNEFLLYLCVEDYVRLRNAMPIPFQVLQAWFVAMHIDLLDGSRDPEIFSSAFPGIREMTRLEQKRRGRVIVASTIAYCWMTRARSPSYLTHKEHPPA